MSTLASELVEGSELKSPINGHLNGLKTKC